MNTKQQTKISKRLSLILRHNPQSVGLELAPNGWVKIADLLQALKSKGTHLNELMLKTLVTENPKQRFEFDESKSSIRARQGYSVKVDLGYTPSNPPELLYHGTPSKYIDSILQEGLKKQQRHHVHMSENIPLMLEVARRRGQPRLIEINAKKMHEEGHQFFVTENQVWLSEYIPTKFIRQIDIETIKT
ncbi:MAG: RNA 2'-phosphotransferase [Akkermansiaceae bacterium]